MYYRRIFFLLELSNYWDDFQVRVNNTIDCLRNKDLPNLDRLTVHLTESCNFHCEYCNMCFSKKTMDKNLVFKIIDEYKEMGGKIIHFTGGEPTIVPYIEEVYKYAKDKGLQVSTNTNGYKKVDTSNIDKLKASFDIPFEDEFNRTMGCNCFSQVVANLKQYSEEMQNKMLSITAVLNRKTYKSMLELAKFVQENFKVYNLYFSNYKGSNSDFAFTVDEIDDMFLNYIPKVLQYFKETDNHYSYKQLSLYKPTDFLNSEFRFQENQVIPCYIQLSEMTIDVDGNCYNCSHLYRDGVVPNVCINVKENNLVHCFSELKRSLNGNYLCLSKKCLSGCNTNLIGFNRAVQKGKKI